VTVACACEHCGHEFDAEPEGGHRLLCGDATSADDVGRLMGGESVHLCLTDPPYGLGGTASSKNDYVEYDDSRDNLIRLIADFLPLAQAAAPVTGAYAGEWQPEPLPAADLDDGLVYAGWRRPRTMGILLLATDPVLRQGPQAVQRRRVSSRRDRSYRGGRKERPPLRQAGNSGTTIVAAEHTGRGCCAIEISPAYCDVAVKRWQAFTDRASWRMTAARSTRSAKRGAENDHRGRVHLPRMRRGVHRDARGRGIGSSAATARSRRTSSACSAASSRP
jgi:hypothetical protein